MDNITQGVIWWSLYTLITKKPTNKQFFLWAAIANIPDIDAFLGRMLFSHPLDQMFFHRGILHSVVFNITLSFILAYVLHRSGKDTSYRRYFLAVSISIFFWHLFVDGMTSYGMRYRLPFSWATTSTDNIFVVDFGMWAITIGWMVWYLFSTIKKRVAQWILALVAGYFAMTFIFQMVAYSIFTHHYPQRWLPLEVIATRTLVEPLQPFLRRHVIKTPRGYYEWYYSLFDQDRDIQWHRRVNNTTGQDLINTLVDQHTDSWRRLRQVVSFSQNMYRVVDTTSGYLIENMTSWPLLWWKTLQQDRMFNFLVQGSGDQYSIDIDRQRPQLSQNMWAEFWQRVWWE